MTESLTVECAGCGEYVELDEARPMFAEDDGYLYCYACHQEAEYADDEIERISAERAIDARLEWAAIHEPMLGIR